MSEALLEGLYRMETPHVDLADGLSSARQGPQHPKEEVRGAQGVTASAAQLLVEALLSEI